MNQDASGTDIGRLGAIVGEWAIEVTFPGGPPLTGGTTTFEWMAGARFLIQRWEVPDPNAPDGVAIIGFDELRNTLVQHYFDSRGVARLYEMTFDGALWTLTRTSEDFSPLNFLQRYRGTFADDGQTISGEWETSSDGEAWEHDFDLAYIRRAGEAVGT